MQNLSVWSYLNIFDLIIVLNHNRITSRLFSSRMEHCHTSHYKSLHSLTAHSVTNRCGCCGHIIWLPDLLDLMNDLFAWGFVKNFSQCSMYIGDVRARITTAFTRYYTANSEWCGKELASQLEDTCVHWGSCWRTNLPSCRLYVWHTSNKS